MEHEWRPASTQPEGGVCMTKIDDAGGVRNEQMLHRKGNLWFTLRMARCMSTTDRRTIVR